MNVTVKVTPVYSEASLMNAVVLVDGKPGRCVGVNSAKAEITVSVPDEFHPWYELTLGDGVRDLVERRPADEAAAKAEADLQARADATATEALTEMQPQ